MKCKCFARVRNTLTINQVLQKYEICQNMEIACYKVWKHYEMIHESVTKVRNILKFIFPTFIKSM